jgi:NAD(P) transhydrogenase subunit alpha
MTAELLAQITVLVLAAVIGFELISRVPSLLHTPLMSATNAIHGVVVVGAMVVLIGPGGAATTVLGFVAVVLATVNVVGGFVVTGRMLEMFRSRPARDRRR